MINRAPRQLTMLPRLVSGGVGRLPRRINGGGGSGLGAVGLGEREAQLLTGILTAATSGAASFFGARAGAGGILSSITPALSALNQQSQSGTPPAPKTPPPPPPAKKLSTNTKIAIGAGVGLLALGGLFLAFR